MKLPAFDYSCPDTLDQALALLAEGDGAARPLAGGQSLLPVMAFRLAAPERLVDLRRIAELKGIEFGPDGLRLGAMLRWRDVLDSAGLRSALPLLPAAIAHVAHYQIRNRGTLGGSLGHADPAAEFPCICIACDATVEIASTAGRREMPVAELITGALETCLAPDELIVAVRFPVWPAGRAWGFQEFALRSGDLALAGVAVAYDLDDGRIRDPRVSLMGAAETARRLPAAEAALAGRHPEAATFALAAAAARDGFEASADMHASADYRRALVETLTLRALRQTMTREAA